MWNIWYLTRDQDMSPKKWWTTFLTILQGSHFLPNGSDQKIFWSTPCTLLHIFVFAGYFFHDFIDVVMNDFSQQMGLVLHHVVVGNIFLVHLLVGERFIPIGIEWQSDWHCKNYFLTFWVLFSYSEQPNGWRVHMGYRVGLWKSKKVSRFGF